MSAGLHVTTYDLSIITTGAASANGEADITTPLPVVGFVLNYNISQNWLVLCSTQAFFLQYQGSKGALTDTNLAIEYRGFENVAFGLGYNKVNLGVEFNDEDYLGTINNKVEGFITYIAVYF